MTVLNDNQRAETPQAVALDTAYEDLAFLPDRTPQTTREDYFAELAGYRDGAIFIAHYAGQSQWERHRAGDEIVLVVEGRTTLILLIDGEETPRILSRGELIVVPRGVWHRFETPEAVKVLSVTPQPTDHQLSRPT